MVLHHEYYENKRVEQGTPQKPKMTRPKSKENKTHQTLLVQPTGSYLESRNEYVTNYVSMDVLMMSLCKSLVTVPHDSKIPLPSSI